MAKNCMDAYVWSMKAERCERGHDSFHLLDAFFLDIQFHLAISPIPFYGRLRLAGFLGHCVSYVLTGKWRVMGSIQISSRRQIAGERMRLILK